jgi:hypothetical protein
MSKCITHEKAGAFLIETKLCKWLQNVKISVKITVITTEEIFGKQKTKISDNKTEIIFFCIIYL